MIKLLNTIWKLYKLTNGREHIYETEFRKKLKLYVRRPKLFKYDKYI